jgi:predicted RNase H-like HicB family nuclease
MTNAEEALNGYIEALLASGKPIPDEGSTSPAAIGLAVEVPSNV